MNVKNTVGRLIATPVIAGILAIEVVKLAYQAAAYTVEIVYDGVRYGDWYL